MLRSLDLFSGLGGITLALKGVCHPVAYCDIDPHVRAVLDRRIADRHLPRAPISPDVKTINGEWLRQQGVGSPDIIVGGFPCVGFSPFGLRKAFDNAGSGLFSEIMRLTDELNPTALFLENVPNILHLGMHVIVSELARKRGYDLTWCIVSAASMGAPHVRKRWFCLAVKVDLFDADLVARRLAEAKYRPYARKWADGAKMPPRMVIIEPGARATLGANVQRSAMCGNSVVPDAVRAAFAYLVDDIALRKRMGPAAYARDTDEPPLYKPWRQGHAATRWPSHGHVSATPLPEAVPVRRRAGAVAKANLVPFAARWGPNVLRTTPFPNILVDPRSFQSHRPMASSLTQKRLRKPVKCRYWSTPRHGNIGACIHLTSRTIRDLPSQIRFEKRTPQELRGGHVAPEFLEWMMGYPIGWTDAGTPPGDDNDLTSCILQCKTKFYDDR